MDICFIVDDPDAVRHPVLGGVIRCLSARHQVRLLDVGALSAAEALVREASHPPAGIYLLKSHRVQALAVARELERRRALVVNSLGSSSACQDRLLMAQRLEAAQLPSPRIYRSSKAEELRFPLMLKSRYSQRGDLVSKVHSTAELRALLSRQPNQGPFILQEFVESDGWDMKVWVIGGEVFAARRRTPLQAHRPQPDIPIAAGAWASLALKVGQAFDLHLYGVDILVTGNGPTVVDVNSFPGFRGVAGADRALSSLIERLGSRPRYN